MTEACHWTLNSKLYCCTAITDKPAAVMTMDMFSTVKNICLVNTNQASIADGDYSNHGSEGGSRTGGSGLEGGLEQYSYPGDDAQQLRLGKVRTGCTVTNLTNQHFFPTPLQCTGQSSITESTHSSLQSCVVLKT